MKFSGGGGGGWSTTNTIDLQYFYKDLLRFTTILHWIIKNTMILHEGLLGIPTD